MSFVSNYYNSLRKYEFLDYHKSVTEQQLDIHKQPHQAALEKFGNVCWYNTKAIGSVGLDVVTGIMVSSLRPLGLCLPLPPLPPEFPTPHTNIQFIDYAVKRALWNWDPAVKKDLLEAIADSYSDKWNVFQVVGEWSLAYALENAHKSSYYKNNPTFLTISEPLENGASYRSVSNDFNHLWSLWSGSNEKTTILNALYRQTPPDSLSAAGKKIYQDIRALASLLHQGNQNYLMAYTEYAQTLSAAAEPHIVEPSAPPLQPSPPRDIQILKGIEFLRKGYLSALSQLPETDRKFATHLITTNGQGHPGYNPKQWIAQICVLQVMQEVYQRQHYNNYPDFISFDTTLPNGISMRHAGMDFANLRDIDFTLLQRAIWNRQLDLPPLLQRRFQEIKEFAAQLTYDPNFTACYEALRIDLLAD